MHTTAPTTPAGWNTVTLTAQGHTLVLPAEPAAPGLVLVPALADTGWAGGYTVIHTASGRHVGPGCLPLAYARELATILAAPGQDWTRTEAALRADRAAREHYFDTVFDLEFARDFGVPLWWARSSWRRVPPPWLISAPTTGSPDDGNDDWVVDTWAHVVALADRAARDGWSPIADDAVVHRARWSNWELVCAAPGCGHRRPGRAPAVLCDWAEDIGDNRPLRTTNRADLITHARHEGWGEHRDRDDQWWMCPACADDHPRNHD